MKLRHLIFAVILAAATADSSGPGANPDPRDKTKDAPPRPKIGSVPLQDRGPSFSSPREKMEENGDRAGHYPPYYHPEPSGGAH